MCEGEVDPSAFRYVNGERRPVEILIFRVDPADVDDFLRIDHDVWTLGEAVALETPGVPFLSKEVWLDEAVPGEITIVIVWPSADDWNAVDDPDIQRRLAAEFDARFGRPYEVVRSAAAAKQLGVRRWSRFERA